MKIYDLPKFVFQKGIEPFLMIWSQTVFYSSCFRNVCGLCSVLSNGGLIISIFPQKSLNRLNIMVFCHNNQSIKEYRMKRRMYIFVLMQVNDNGVISFGSRYNVRTPLSLPLNGTDKIIAPYWADVDTRGTGKVFYRQTTDPALLARATSEIREAFSNSENITITDLLIATWDNVGYYNQKSDKVLCII